MPTRISFDFFGEAQVNRTLERVALGAEDASPAWEAMAERFVAVERRHFRAEGGDKGTTGTWAPLSPKYAAWKARHYPGKPILRRTDELLRSLTVRPLDVEVILPDRMVIGSLVEYGRYHQAGTDRMPRRRPVDLSDAERREWVKVLQRFLITGQAPGVGPRGGFR